MKRVLHIIGVMDRAGAETMLMNLYRNIDRARLQFDFLVFTDRPGDFDEEIKLLGGKIYPILASNNFLRMKKIYHFLKNHPEYKIVHAHTLLNNMFSLAAAKWAGVPVRIAHSHNTENRRYGFIASLYESFGKKAISRLATNKMACGIEAAHYLFPKERDVHIFPNGVEVDELATLKTKTLYFPFFKKDALNIIQIGRLSDQKNPFFTLKIAEEMKKVQFPGHIFMVGEGALRSMIENAIKKEDLQEYITLLGLRSDVPEIMAVADLLIMPSFHEGFPVVLAESQAVGIPALVSTGVSQEVDLEVNRIQFLDINNPVVWVTEFEKYKIFSGDKNRSQRVRILKEKGFDVVENARILTQMYKEMLKKNV